MPGLWWSLACPTILKCRKHGRPFYVAGDANVEAGYYRFLRPDDFTPIGPYRTRAQVIAGNNHGR